MAALVPTQPWHCPWYPAPLLWYSILSVQQVLHDSSSTDPVANHTLSLAQPRCSLEVTVPSLVVLSPPQSLLPSLATAVGALGLCSAVLSAWMGAQVPV